MSNRIMVNQVVNLSRIADAMPLIKAPEMDLIEAEPVLGTLQCKFGVLLD